MSNDYMFFMNQLIFSALFSLGLFLSGIQEFYPIKPGKPCYHYELIYGLYIVPIITSYFSVLGMAIERFQSFALYTHKDRRILTRRFSISWSITSWTLAFCFFVMFLSQIGPKTWQELPEEEKAQLNKIRREKFKDVL